MVHSRAQREWPNVGARGAMARGGTMSMLSNILDKLGLSRADPKPAAVAQPASAAQTGTFGQTGAAPQTTRPQTAPAAPAAPAGQPPGAASVGAPAAPEAGAGQPTRPAAVDVTAKLESLAAGNREKLNWRESIVDLLKLLGMDSSLAARKELATELGCPADKMADSAQMNMWLHKAVVRKLAENGGNVPKELLD
jgi:hypothetical protein